MSWITKEKSKTGVIQYINASYTEALSTTTTTSSNSFNVIGYTKGSISYLTSYGAQVSQLVVNLQGSDDNTNYFNLNSSNTHGTFGNGDIGEVSWNIPIKFVRVSTTVTTTLRPGDINSLDLVVSAGGGGGGGDDSNNTSIIEPPPGGTNTQVQYNDNSFFGGAPGVLYDTDEGQIQLTAGTAALPVISFSDDTHPSGNYDTGIYEVGANQIGFTIAGSVECAISTSNLSISAGNASIPSINFGLESGSNTGMFQIDSDTIGFSTGSVEKVSIYPSNSGNFIEGLNIGTTGRIAGIRRLSATAANSWEDGNLGNSSALVFTSTDFGITSSRSVVKYNPARSSNLTSVVGGATTIRAQKLIPKGFQIVSGAEFTIFCNTNIILGATATIIAGPIDGSTAPITRFSDVISTNTSIALTSVGSDIGDGVNSITIVYTPTLSMTIIRSIIGATINMERV